MSDVNHYYVSDFTIQSYPTLEIKHVVYRRRSEGLIKAVALCQSKKMADEVLGALTDKDELLAACKAALPYMADLTEEGTTERESKTNRGECDAYRKLLSAVANAEGKQP